MGCLGHRAARFCPRRLTTPRTSATLDVEIRFERVGLRMFGLGAWELGIILLIVVVLFGARRLPEIGSGMGKAIKNFKAGLSEKGEIDVTPEPEPEKDSVTDAKSDT